VPASDALPYVVIDPISLDFTKGATLNFATELIGSSFRIEDNPQASGGCGCGVSFERKEEDLGF
jgi:iron-sulfur cluster assembly accessory protein